MPTPEELIYAALRCDCPIWPSEYDEEFIARFLERSAYHGVQPLLYKILQNTRNPELNWPKQISEHLRNSAVSQAFWEVSHRVVLKEVLAALFGKGVQPILFKGTALAYDIYPSPSLRTRGDSDLLIPVQDRDQVCATLESLGFECELGVKGDLISHTAVYSRPDPKLGTHQFDIHWRISNAAVLSKLYSYEELHCEARPLTALSPEATAVDPANALLIACMHKAGHKNAPFFVNGVEHLGGDRIIWLYDVHLLLGRLLPAERERLAKIAAEKGLRETCLEAIEQSTTYLHTVVPKGLYERLSLPGPAGTASRYLGASAFAQYRANFLAAEGVQNKLRFITQILFPPEKYMRQVYPHVKPSWLPWLYLRRAITVSIKRVRQAISARTTAL